MSSPHEPENRLAQDGEPNAAIGVSWGDVQHPHHVIVWMRHAVQPCYRAVGQHELPPQANPNDVAATIWKALRGLCEIPGIRQPCILVDATVAGRSALNTVRENREASPNIPASGYVVGVRSVLPSAGRSDIAAHLASVLAAEHFYGSAKLREDLGRFKYHPETTAKANGEDAWRIDDCDGPGFAAGIGLRRWWFRIGRDIQLGQHGVDQRERKTHPACAGSPLCMCRRCPRCSHGADAMFQRMLVSGCDWCRTHGDQTASQLSQVSRSDPRLQGNRNRPGRPPYL